MIFLFVDPEVTWELLLSAEAIANLDELSSILKEKNWCSKWMRSRLQQHCPSGGLVEQWPQILDEISNLVNATKQDRANKNYEGQVKARQVLGTFGQLMGEVDALPFATKAICGWVLSYLGNRAGAWGEYKVVPYATVAPRPVPIGALQRSMFELLEAAVQGALKVHPEWPVTFSGVVRSGGRKEKKVTCVAMRITYSPTKNFAVIWNAESDVPF